MLLFKPYHIQPILEDSKTQTRRIWPHGCRVKVGSIHQARTRMLDKSSAFARLRILWVWRENIWSISEADARKEGYSSRGEYLLAFTKINHIVWNGMPLLVWCVEFELMPDI